ncbi:MAG: MarP family serine protease [Streptosporangiaceae bacterium]
MLTAAVRTGDLLDLILIVLAVVVGIRGFRQGLLVGAASLVGFIGGAVIGSRIAGPIARLVTGPLAQSLVALITVLVVAIVLQELLVYLAVIIRRVLRVSPLRFFDAIFGTVFSVAAMLFVAWLLGLAVINSPFTSLARQVRHSRILTAVDNVVPNSVYLAFSSFLRAVETNDLPPVFAGLNPPLAPPVAAPVAGAVPASVIRADAPSIVKIVAIEPECGQQTEGSGFVYAPGHVLTNAHVVAGARSVEIVGDGTGARIGLAARVVFFDPNTDIAVLYVPGLTRPSLTLGPPVSAGAPAEVVGYPENGPFTPTPARVAARQLVSGPNIYSDATVTREIYVLRATVRPGNSGGPLLAPDGRVDGVVFAASTVDPATGYALTAGQVSADARAGASATRPVGTRSCA